MAAEIRRNMYKRGSSFETTIPMPLLFGIDEGKEYDVIFSYNEGKNRWYVRFEERNPGEGKDGK